MTKEKRRKNEKSKKKTKDEVSERGGEEWGGVGEEQETRQRKSNERTKTYTEGG